MSLMSVWLMFAKREKTSVSSWALRTTKLTVTPAPPPTILACSRLVDDSWHNRALYCRHTVHLSLIWFLRVFVSKKELNNIVMSQVWLYPLFFSSTRTMSRILPIYRTFLLWKWHIPLPSIKEQKHEWKHLPRLLDISSVLILCK